MCPRRSSDSSSCSRPSRLGGIVSAGLCGHGVEEALTPAMPEGRPRSEDVNQEVKLLEAAVRGEVEKVELRARTLHETGKWFETTDFSNAFDTVKGTGVGRLYLRRWPTACQHSRRWSPKCYDTRPAGEFSAWTPGRQERSLAPAGSNGDTPWDRRCCVRRFIQAICDYTPFQARFADDVCHRFLGGPPCVSNLSHATCGLSDRARFEESPLHSVSQPASEVCQYHR